MRHVPVGVVAQGHARPPRRRRVGLARGVLVALPILPRQVPDRIAKAHTGRIAERPPGLQNREEEHQVDDPPDEGPTEHGAVPSFGLPEGRPERRSQGTRAGGRTRTVLSPQDASRAFPRRSKTTLHIPNCNTHVKASASFLSISTESILTISSPRTSIRVPSQKIRVHPRPIPKKIRADPPHPRSSASYSYQRPLDLPSLPPYNTGQTEEGCKGDEGGPSRRRGLPPRERGSPAGSPREEAADRSSPPEPRPCAGWPPLSGRRGGRRPSHRTAVNWGGTAGQIGPRPQRGTGPFWWEPAPGLPSGVG